MLLKNIPALSVFLMAWTSCRKQPELEAYRAEILELHQKFIEAHLAKDASFFAGPGLLSIKEAGINGC